ncbi:hypothetical protein ACQF5M_22960, partial [Klebsiella pneumoniae]
TTVILHSCRKDESAREEALRRAELGLLICISEFCPFFRHIRTLKFGVVLFSYIFFGFRGNKC